MQEENDIAKFDNIEYLKTGTNDQQVVYNILKKNQIFTILKDFTPILAGTFPININIPGSDLDIICEFHNNEKFKEIILKYFSQMSQFTLLSYEVRNYDVLQANFILEGFEIEIFGQNRPVKEQNAYRHMIVEYLILQRKGKAFRQKILNLKLEGLKTEPAFAETLLLSGDPYQAILNL
ncbi:MAG: DUF4269 domain-containing protein [Bacteroides sp.]|nr:DUF4269 domain-containing protein [Bacteroides sp.]